MNTELKTSFTVIYEFGEFRLIPSERILELNGETVSLPPKVFDTLILLVENHGHLIEKDEFLESVWGDTFVEEATLARTISRLRKALDKKDNNKYIETVPKKGYRFIETVKIIDGPQTANENLINNKIDSSNNDSKDQANSSHINPQKWFAKPRVLFVGAIVLLSLTALAYMWRSGFYENKSVTSIKTMAVLPFKTLGNAEEDKALEVAMADALITKLGNVEQIVVLPTSAIYRYAETDNLNPENVGRKLNVDAVLDGTIQKDGERLRVNIQLINVTNGISLWSEKFDSEDKDIFVLQDNISEQVTNALELKLSGKEKDQLTKRYTENREAYDAYMRGRYLWNKRNPKDFKRSLDLFQKAIELDPNYALAYTGIADCYHLFAEYRMMPVNEGFAKARSAARKALEIDDALAEAHTSLGYILAFYDWDFKSAEKEFKRAIELNPNYSTAYQWYAEYLIAMGRFEEADGLIKKVLALDPLSPIIGTLSVGYLFTIDNCNKAIEEANKVIDINPEFGLVYGFQAICYFENGKRDEGIDAWIKSTELTGTRSETERSELREIWKNDGWEGFWNKWLKQIEANPQFHLAWDRAITNLYLGEEEKAIDWLEKSLNNRERWIINIKYAPIYNSIRSKPRVQNIIRKIDFE